MTTAIEEHLAHQDAAIDDISKEMSDQWAAIRRLERKLDRVIEHLRMMQEDSQGGTPNAPPPHY